MATSKIEWLTGADGTPGKSWNPLTGCHPISAGCAHCYAARMAKRLAGRYGYPAGDGFAVAFHPERLGQPSSWRHPQRIFVESMGDPFHVDVKDEWLDQVFTEMWMVNAVQKRGHTFILLTKRQKRMRQYITQVMPKSLPIAGREWPWPGVWLGISAEDEGAFYNRVGDLLATPAAKHIVSLEPLLGPISMRGASFRDGSYLNASLYSLGAGTGIDWVIAGAETGPGARPADPDWFRSVRDQCVRADVPFFLKQIDAHHNDVLDGQVWHQFPGEVQR